VQEGQNLLGIAKMDRVNAGPDHHDGACVGHPADASEEQRTALPLSTTELHCVPQNSELSSTPRQTRKQNDGDAAVESITGEIQLSSGHLYMKPGCEGLLDPMATPENIQGSQTAVLDSSSSLQSTGAVEPSTKPKSADILVIDSDSSRPASSYAPSHASKSTMKIEEPSQGYFPHPHTSVSPHPMKPGTTAVAYRPNTSPARVRFEIDEATIFERFALQPIHEFVALW
jgi:hypothetical protein